ncbi:hypothetical protein H6P81_017528 [Aristolochia fimbriata]|uniref:Uncharacterized protein n=1 Tax=Aristolochia fimbriata TaxID=158543 RepID=A0AAV7DZH2_ARIFI|nr:hypothetical protein H6P81_017528 [Aristolochia fimbriata]
MGSQSNARPFFCSVVGVDTTNLFYRVCAVCERTLPENSTCRYCDYKAFNPGSSGSKRVYRILTLQKLYKFGPPKHIKRSLPEPSQCTRLQNSHRDVIHRSLPESSEYSRSGNTPRDIFLNYLSELGSRMRTAQRS